MGSCEGPLPIQIGLLSPIAVSWNKLTKYVTALGATDQPKLNNQPGYASRCIEQIKWS